MNRPGYLDFLSTQPLVSALWWFIENADSLEAAERTEIFFALRERVRDPAQ
ncbi:MAG TPA: hypothetical protein PKZ27_02945 [Rhodocyclaceae bacterium]|nr:hypothetical protein [Burkholderiaceae bacterium]HRP74523.1 hypothetical protein [Rhodocyclaceae bacterium]